MFDALFTTTTEYKKLSHALSGKGACALFGLPASGRAQVYAALCRQLDKPLCIVTPGEAEATRFAADLNTLGIPAAVFPARDYVLRSIEGTARRIRVPPPGCAGRAGRRAAARRGCACGSPDPVHHPKRGFLRQHPHPPCGGYSAAG